ncbi:MAG: alpha/beta hydrolase, partial [Eudoraea sp.]
MAKPKKNRQKIRIIYAFLISIMLMHCVYPQDTILPLWPADAVPNRIESDEVEILEKGAIQRISYVQYPQIEVYLPSEANSTGKAM